MRIVTYASSNAPVGAGWIARLRVDGVKFKGVIPEEWHPVIFTAHDEPTVRAKAQAWWDDALSTEAKKQANAAAAGAHLKAARTVAGSAA